jgi:hypothetical protein
MIKLGSQMTIIHDWAIWRHPIPPGGTEALRIQADTVPTDTVMNENKQIQGVRRAASALQDVSSRERLIHLSGRWDGMAPFQTRARSDSGNLVSALKSVPWTTSGVCSSSALRIRGIDSPVCETPIKEPRQTAGITQSMSIEKAIRAATVSTRFSPTDPQDEGFSPIE